MVYFAQHAKGWPVKIGWTTDAKSRVRELESTYKMPLVLLAEIPGETAREREIHNQFKHLRFDGTEQFRPAPELSEFIGCDLGGCENAESPMVVVGYGQVIAEARVRNDLSQIEACKALGLNLTTLRAYEQGKRTISVERRAFFAEKWGIDRKELGLDLGDCPCCGRPL